MRYLIDTTVLIPYFAGNPQADMLIKQLLPDGVAVSILSYLEAYQGAIEEADPEAAKRQFNAFSVAFRFWQSPRPWQSAVRRFAPFSKSKERTQGNEPLTL